MSKRDEYLTYLKELNQSFDTRNLQKIFEGQSDGPKIKQPRLLNKLLDAFGLSSYDLSDSFSRIIHYFHLSVDRDDRVEVNDTELSTVLHTLLHLKSHQGQLLMYTDEGWGTVEDKKLNYIINAVSVTVLNTKLHSGQKLSRTREYLQENAPETEEMTVRSHIQTMNGCFNTKTGIFEDHSPNRIPLIRLRANLEDFNPMETDVPAIFDNFVKQSVESDTVYYEYLMDVFASLLDSNAPTSTTGVILHGSGGNGKTVLMDVLQSMFDPTNVAVKSLDDMGKNFGLSNLNHAMINISHELSSSKPQAEAIRQLKRLLDKDPGPSEVNEKFKKPVNRVLDIKMIFASNAVVDFGKAHKVALSRRLTVLPFNYQPPSIDSTLKNKLISEKEQIIAYLMKRIADIHQRSSLSPEPSVVTESKKIWFSSDGYIDSNPQLSQEIKSWLNNNIERSKGSRVNKVELSDALKNEIPKATAQKCNKIIENLFKFQMIKDTHGRYWKDMRYKSSNEATNDNSEPDMFLEEHY